MSKKIVVVTGSPRKNGNTSALTVGFEESEHWYAHLKKHIGWQSLGKVLCGYVTQTGDIEGKKELNDAYELGKSIK